MKTINELKETYLKNQGEIQKVRNHIEERLMQVKRLQKKELKLEHKNWWGDIFIRPIMALVKNKYPQIIWDDDKLTPMGICSRVSLFGKINGETKIILCFTPSNLKEGKISYDTEEREGIYPENSIGYWNDMNKISEQIEDIEQIYAHIEKQL